jgi:hypothetical protein
MLGLLVASSGKHVTTLEIAKALGKKQSGHLIAGMLGAFGRRLKSRHKGRWPFSKKWDAVEKCWAYVMPSPLAESLSKIVDSPPPKAEAK